MILYKKNDPLGKIFGVDKFHRMQTYKIISAHIRLINIRDSSSQTNQVEMAGGQKSVEPGARPQLIRQDYSQGAGSQQAGGQVVVIKQPGVRPGQPSLQITVSLSTLQSLQPGQVIPTRLPGHLLIKTETGHYQILRIGSTSDGGNTTTAVQLIQGNAA